MDYRAVAKAYNLGDESAFSKISHNSGNDVYLSKNHVIKLFTSTAVPVKEARLCELLHGQLPTPKVIGYSKHSEATLPPHLVLTRLPGEPLSLQWNTLTASERQTLCRQLGALLATVHSFPVSKLSRLESSASLAARIRNTLPKLETEKLISATQLITVKRYLNKHTHIQTESSLTHGCFRFGNILVQEGKVTGLLDWEDALIGDPIEELSLTLYRTIPSEFHTTFLDGYQELKPVEIDRLNDTTLVYPLLYFLKYLPEIRTWTAFPGKQAYYTQETKKILGEIADEEN